MITRCHWFFSILNEDIWKFCRIFSLATSRHYQKIVKPLIRGSTLVNQNTIIVEMCIMLRWILSNNKIQNVERCWTSTEMGCILFNESWSKFWDRQRRFTWFILTQDFVRQQLGICPASFHKRTDFRPRDFSPEKDEFSALHFYLKCAWRRQIDRVPNTGIQPKLGFLSRVNAMWLQTT